MPGGAGWSLLVGAAVGGALAAVSAGVLKAYQVDRFLAFVDPSLDPRGAGYNVEQARIAIGNGGLLGQGLFDGSQTRAGFVPEQQTDFVFTVAGEELGLLGAGVLIALLCVVIWRALVIARRAEDVFGRVCAAGIACWFGFQAFQNIGMCLGIMPVTGVPLPFVSYGGSSLFAGLLAVGLLQNIHLRSGSRRTRSALAERRVLRALRQLRVRCGGTSGPREVSSGGVGGPRDTGQGSAPGPATIHGMGVTGRRARLAVAGVLVVGVAVAVVWVVRDGDEKPASNGLPPAPQLSGPLEVSPDRLRQDEEFTVTTTDERVVEGGFSLAVWDGVGWTYQYQLLGSAARRRRRPALADLERADGLRPRCDPGQRAGPPGHPLQRDRR